MSTWKDEYKNRWFCKRARLLRENLKNAENAFERSERALARRIFFSRVFDGFYFALVGGIVIAAGWFLLSLFGIVPLR